MSIHRPLNEFPRKPPKQSTPNSIENTLHKIFLDFFFACSLFQNFNIRILMNFPNFIQCRCGQNRLKRMQLPKFEGQYSKDCTRFLKKNQFCILRDFFKPFIVTIAYGCKISNDFYSKTPKRSGYYYRQCVQRFRNLFFFNFK